MPTQKYPGKLYAQLAPQNEKVRFVGTGSNENMVKSTFEDKDLGILAVNRDKAPVNKNKTFFNQGVAMPTPQPQRKPASEGLSSPVSKLSNVGPSDTVSALNEAPAGGMNYYTDPESKNSWDGIGAWAEKNAPSSESMWKYIGVDPNNEEQKKFAMADMAQRGLQSMNEFNQAQAQNKIAQAQNLWSGFYPQWANQEAVVNPNLLNEVTQGGLAGAGRWNQITDAMAKAEAKRIEGDWLKANALKALSGNDPALFNKYQAIMARQSGKKDKQEQE